MTPNRFVFKTIFFFVCMMVAPSLLRANSVTRVHKILTLGYGAWGPSSAAKWGWAIYFKGNNKAQLSFIGEGGPEYKAAYKVRGKTVRIWITEKFDEFPRDHKKLRNMKCRIFEPRGSIRHRYALSCTNGMKFWNFDNKLVNQRRKVGDLPVLTVGNRVAHVTANTNFRAAPNLKAKRLYCSLDSGAPVRPAKRAPYLPRGWTIFLLARTLKREQIGKWNNYWYYVDVTFDPHDGEDCKQAQGWVYGQFVKLGKADGR